MDNTVTIVHRYMFVSCCYPVHLTTELVYQNEFRIQHGKPVMCLLVYLLECRQKLENSTPLCNGKGSNADKVQYSETSRWSPRQLIKTILKTLRQPQSHVLM